MQARETITILLMVVVVNHLRIRIMTELNNYSHNFIHLTIGIGAELLSLLEATKSQTICTRPLFRCGRKLVETAALPARIHSQEK